MEEIESRFQDAIKQRRLHGIAACASKGNNVIYSSAFGKLDLNSSSDDMTVDTAVHLFSMTKAFTCVAAVQLIEAGKLSLDAEVHSIIPEVKGCKVLEGFDDAKGDPVLSDPRTTVTVRHLLTHTSGFAYKTWSEAYKRYTKMSNIPGISTRTYRSLIGALVNHPGERWCYGSSIDWLGWIIERVTRENLEAYMKAHIFKPLGMDHTSFVCPKEMYSKRLQLLQRQPDGSLETCPFDTFKNGDQVEMLNGGHGCFGTASDYLKFCTALANGGAPILSVSATKMLLSNHTGDLPLSPIISTSPSLSVDYTPHPNSSWSLLGERTEVNLEGRRRSGSNSWSGLANTYFWVDPEEKVAGVVISQVLPFGDPTVTELYEAFEKAI
ncbi:beta-lactamase [Gonapodya prolifera JEL478]|uniref:Beta-lactamase n=1 Tax=Gonapodya prolifera (strain JEL478) TaxID=1344416 RepID=A0A139AE69_GONPJ|nr:beta-lactamase [Gonapodya prolifera JEL478]|eukprot:KXS14713.1 beta-lactamase [Gonapodya prolifera JEL478]